jgi:hypothetical protein
MLLKDAFEHLKYVSNLQKVEVFASTVLMNEIAVYLKYTWRSTIDITRMRHVLLEIIVLASMKIAVVLAVKAGGSKVIPMEIFKG